MFKLNHSKLTLALAGFISLSLAATGCGKGSNNNPNVAGIKYSGSFVNNAFVLSTTFQGLQLDGGGRFPIKGMGNSYVEIGPDFQSNGTLLSVGLDVTDIKAAAAAHMLDPTQLPGGRPLPGLASGQMPGIAVEIPSLKGLVVYAGNNAFGAFVPVKLPIDDAIATFRFYADGAKVGNISIVGRDKEKSNSGILILVNAKDPNVSKLLK